MGLEIANIGTPILRKKLKTLNERDANFIDQTGFSIAELIGLSILDNNITSILEAKPKDKWKVKYDLIQRGRTYKGLPP